jgi:hypothetical protein
MYKEKLIELLSDYMDKTLSTWCYIDRDWEYFKKIQYFRFFNKFQ